MSNQLVPLNCRIPSDLKEELAKIADGTGLTLTDVVVEALKKSVKIDRAAASGALSLSPEISEQVRYLVLLTNSKSNELLWSKLKKEAENLWQMIEK